MSDSIQLASAVSTKGVTDLSDGTVLDAWPYRELELELQMFTVSGPAASTVTVSLETASVIDGKGPITWHALGCFAPLGDAGSDRRRFGRLLRFVRWRAQTSHNTVTAVFSIQGMAR